MGFLEKKQEATRPAGFVMRNTTPKAYTAVPTGATKAGGHIHRNQRSRCRNPFSQLRRLVGHDHRNHRSRWTGILSYEYATILGLPKESTSNRLIQGTSNERLRNQLVLDGILAAQSGLLVFTRDHLFTSPSMAAMAVMGRSANGWIEWKAANGKTLDEVKRQVVGAEVLGG